MLATIFYCILAILAFAVLVVLILASMKPDTFQIRRSAAIAAQPERIYPLIADFRAWAGWSPWEKKDPNQTRTMSGAASGVGAIYGWSGNKNVGEGRMEIVEAVPSSRVGLKLDFIKPFEAHNHVVFELQPQGPATHVVWTMSGPTPFVAKIMHVFFSMDKMVGPDFEAGLASLKALAER